MQGCRMLGRRGGDLVSGILGGSGARGTGGDPTRYYTMSSSMYRTEVRDKSDVTAYLLPYSTK